MEERKNEDKNEARCGSVSLSSQLPGRLMQEDCKVEVSLCNLARP
jgi:hypothetical protein